MAGADFETPEPVGAMLDDGEASRVLLELAAAAAGIGTFDWDLLTGTLHWDERLLELFGYDEEDFDQTIAGFNARLHPEDLPGVTALLQQAIDTCGEYESEYRVVTPDGSSRWLAARGRALCDEHGVTVRVLGAAWDVTTGRRAQDRLAQILEGMAVGFLAVDREWVITHVNLEAEHITSTPRSQLLGRTLWEQFPATVGTEFENHYRRAVDTGEPVTFDAYYPEPLNVWVEVRAVPAEDGLALYFLDITADRRADQLSEQAARRERLLGAITEELIGSLAPDEVVTRLSRLVVPDVADWCLVTLLDDHRSPGSPRGLRTAASWHANPEMRPVAEAYARSRLTALTDDAIIVRAMQTGQMQLLASQATADAAAMLVQGPVRDLLLRLAPESVAVLPLPGRTGPVGMLTLANGQDRGAFTAADLVMFRHIAARAGLVLDNARLYRQQRDLAEGLQRAMLTPPPEPDHVQIVVRYAPAAQTAQVGGDWYDAFLQPEGGTVLVIGDVVGHDTEAAAAMGQIRTIVRTLGAEDDHGPAEILHRTDRVMATLQTGTAATAVVARLEQTPDERHRGITRLRWSNAGHPPPMVINPDGTVLPLQTVSTDRLLGVTPEVTRRESEVTLDRGAVVLLYTDGLVERRDQDLDSGLARLQETLGELADRDLDGLCDELLARLLPEYADDDVAIVAVRLHRQDRPRTADAAPNRMPPTGPPEG